MTSLVRRPPPAGQIQSGAGGKKGGPPGNTNIPNPRPSVPPRPGTGKNGTSGTIPQPVVDQYGITPQQQDMYSNKYGQSSTPDAPAPEAQPYEAQPWESNFQDYAKLIKGGKSPYSAWKSMEDRMWNTDDAVDDTDRKRMNTAMRRVREHNRLYQQSLGHGHSEKESLRQANAEWDQRGYGRLAGIRA